jgi:hypothetical protein
VSQTIHPLEATQRIQDDYTRYLRTIYFFRDEELRRQFWQALERPQFLVRGPILEASPPFRTGRSIASLIEAGILHPDFRQLCSAALPLDRSLYLHQDQAIEKIVAQERNGVVATGTGSGKTEAFLIPIFDHLLHQREVGLLQQPGVRALLLYPMNALANDQLKRLRRLLAHFPDITFGRYTGETEEQQSRAESLFREQFRGEPLLPNELISRERMREGPPHVLITNYAMLEYLLLRPKDSELFDGETGQFWRFIVLDEAHIYDGAAGIEIAMLLRRLKDRVVQSEPGRLRCIATSATLGKGREDFPAVARFTSELFGEPFEWIEDDPQRQDVVEGLREEMAQLGTRWGEGTNSLYAALTEAMADKPSPQALADLAVAQEVPETIARKALESAASSGNGAGVVNRFLYGLLQGDQRLHHLRSALEEPRHLSELALEMADEDPTSDTVVNLVRLAVRARPAPDAVSLLPARYHVFARALEGAFVCLNQRHPAHTEAGHPWLFLNRHEACPHCQSRVFELATCPRCGTAYIVGREVTTHPESGVLSSSKGGILSSSKGGRRYPILRHPTASTEDLTAGLSYFVLTEQVQRPDEDEAVVMGDTLDLLEAERLEPQAICLGCGAVGPAAERPPCTCRATTPSVILQRVLSEEDPLRRCVACGARSSVYRFLTGQDAPVSVLATSLYQLLPPATDERAATLPGQGRKLLVFADSRQDAAFFAPYLERTYQQILRRRLILKALSEDREGRSGRLRLQDLVSRVLQEAEGAGFFTAEQSYDERTNLVRLWLMQEFTALDYRISLEGLGLLHFRPAPPDGWEPPAPLLEPPWSLSREEVWNLLVTLLDSLRQQGAVTFPPNVDPRDSAFEPRNVELFVRDYADEKQQVLGWLPKRGGNRRVDYLVRLLNRRAGLSMKQAEQAAVEMLGGIWRYFIDPASLWHDHLAPEQRARVGAVYRLNHRFWEWVPAAEADIPVYRCNRCFNVSYVNLDGICPAYTCDGILERVDGQAEAWEGNHYRHLYQTLTPIPLGAEEHTAQWTPKVAGEVQDRFIRGEINVLSCSTTFELGVDVGELQAVLMRNVPPTTANYVQRAGRAGRRTDSVAFVLTYAQRRSHDLTHFNQPERMVAGRIQPPVVIVSNEKIVRRHVHSVFLAAFFRWARDQHERLFPFVGDFFDPNDGGPSGPDLLQQYLRQPPLAVREALQRIVPSELHTALDITNWGWLPRLISDERTGILDAAVQEVHNDLELYAQLEQEAVQARKYRQAEHFQRVATTVRKRELLGFLGTRNVLPKYGFPTDVVELRTHHILLPEARRVELDRDLRIAISEYAPGGEVVAAKRIWRGGGLYSMPGRDWQTFYYAVCPGCGRFHRSLEPLDDRCSVCGANVYGWPKRYGQFVIPEFGFVAGRDAPPTGERRPQRIYASRVYFSEYAPADGEEQAVLEQVVELSGATVQVERRYSRYGKLAVVNDGFGDGFRICNFCGWAEPVVPTPPGRRSRQKQKQEHENPRTGQGCTGYVVTYHLGHEFITDVLEIRFTGVLAPPDDRDLWLSTLYAVLEGASEALGIARDDLDGTLYPYQAGLPPALVLFDNVPGGAGHVRRIGKDLPLALRAAWDRVARCECGEETSCYECLRNFYNQYHHDQLRRGLARDFLSTLLQRNA